jgi:hypothetical protein
VGLQSVRKIQRRSDGVEVAVAGGDELCPALDGELAVAFAAHAAAGFGVALEHFHVVPGALETPRAGQPRHTAADDHDGSHD